MGVASEDTGGMDMDPDIESQAELVCKLFENHEAVVDGYVSWSDVKTHTTCPEMQKYLGMLGIDVSDLFQLFMALSGSDKERIPIHDLIMSCMKSCGDAKRRDIAVHCFHCEHFVAQIRSVEKQMSQSMHWLRQQLTVSLAVEK